MFASAFVVMRAQYEAALRGVWALYSATDRQIEWPSSRLDSDAEQAAKSLPSGSIMLDALAKVLNAKVPYDPFLEFKGSAWPALLRSTTSSSLESLGTSFRGFFASGPSPATAKGALFV